MATLQHTRQRHTNWPLQGAWTYADWERLPDDGFRYEVLDGELYMSPPPSIAHQNSVATLLTWMRQHAKKHRLGLVLTVPVGVRLPTQNVPVQPDILFVHHSRAQIIGDQYIEGAPDLIVEVLSPSNWVYDRGKKQEIYREAGVREYWIVDLRAKTVDILLLEDHAYVLQNQYIMGDTAVSPTLTNFTIPVQTIFSEYL